MDSTQKANGLAPLQVVYEDSGCWELVGSHPFDKHKILIIRHPKRKVAVSRLPPDVLEIYKITKSKVFQYRVNQILQRVKRLNFLQVLQN